jgi:hypothetical protein
VASAKPVLEHILGACVNWKKTLALSRGGIGPKVVFNVLVQMWGVSFVLWISTSTFSSVTTVEPAAHPNIAKRSM